MGFKRREQKNVHLGVRVLQAQIAWLDAPLCWEDGRLTWEGIVPSSGLLWKTQKRINELRALGKSIASEQLRLEQTKWLITLTESDTWGGLVAEALCDNELPFSPSVRLARQGSAALPALRMLAADPLTPCDAQPLIALMTAVCEGRRQLPRYPDLTARLLALDPAFPTALLAELPVLTLTPESLRRLVREGLSVAEVLRWLEGAHAKKPLLRLPVLCELLGGLPFPSALVAIELAELLLRREQLPPEHTEVTSPVYHAPEMLEALGPVLALSNSPEWLACVVQCASELWPQPEIIVKARLKGIQRGEAILRKARHWRGECQARVQQLYDLFERCQDGALCGEVLRSGSLWALDFSSPDPDLYRLAWSLIQEFSSRDLNDLFARYSSVAEFRADFGEMLQGIRALPERMRNPFFNGLVYYFEDMSRDIRRQIPLLAPRLRLLVPLFPEAEGESIPNWWLGGLMAVMKDLTDAQVTVVITVIKKHASFDINRGKLAARLAQGSEVLVGPLLGKLLAVELDWVPLSAAETFSQQLSRFPTLVPLLVELALEQPRKAIERMAQLGEALRLGLDALAPLHVLTPLTGPLPDAWEPVAMYLPDSSDLTWAATEPLPSGMARLLALPERLQREAMYLAERPALTVRYNALQARLADPEALWKTISDELAEAVAQRARVLRFDALKRAVEEVYRNRLRTILGSRAQTVTMTADVMNAALLTLDIGTNRRLLIRLLRAYFDGDTSWALRQKPNVAFLEALTECGVDAVAWRSPQAETLGGLHLHLETDPLHVLQMGNYFDTCLSFGGCNAFSTVANACDANKRVLYVRDGKGRIVARQLLAIGAEGKLLGFHVYSTLSQDERPKLTHAILDYVTRFAQRCGLELGTEGIVPKLLAEDWYDDGVSDWGALVVQAPPVSASTSSRSPHGSLRQTPAPLAP